MFQPIVADPTTYDWRLVHAANYTTYPPFNAATAGSFLRDSLYKERTNNPNYKASIKAKIDAGGNYYLRQESFSQSSGSVGCTVQYHFSPHPDDNGTATIVISGPLCSRNPGLNNQGRYGGIDVPLDLKNRVHTKFLQKLASQSKKFEGGVFLGELRETVALLRHPAQGLRKGLDLYLRAAKKRTAKSKTAKDATRVLGDLWLEFKFGWSPLEADIEDALIAYNDIVNRGPPIERVHHSGELVVNLDDPGTYESFSDSRFRWRNHYRATRVFTYGLLAHYSADAFASAPNEKLGLGPENWVPTLWELIPYSFVVDYFSNIGDCISAGCMFRPSPVALYSTTTLRNVGNFKSYMDREHTLNAFSDPASYGACSIIESQASLEFRMFSFERTRISIDSVNVWPQAEVPSLGSTKWLNIAALVNSGRDAESTIRSRIRR